MTCAIGIQAVMEMVARGEEKSALDFLDATQRRLDEHKLIRWCRPPVLNAVFSSYFDQAQNQDIPVEADISLPDTLPVDEGELAIVLGKRPGKCHPCQSPAAREAAEDPVQDGGDSRRYAGAFQSMR